VSGLSDIEKIVDALDALYMRLNTIITTREFIVTTIVPNIIKTLRELNCEYHSMQIRGDEIRVLFSTSDNKTCIGVVIELYQIRDTAVKLKSHYYIQGDSCDFKLF
jgi:hypothetical protein